jgi:hypothetical protein
VKGQTMVDYIGDGEVLDVLNTPKDGKIALEIDKNENIITDENYITILPLMKFKNTAKLC